MNVFVENLQTARKLDTTYYVTAMKQQTDFFWYRDSGIRVNIGLQNINIMPVYDDVDHSGAEYRPRVDDVDDAAPLEMDSVGFGADNEFILSNPNVGPEEKERFREIVQTVCRCVASTCFKLSSFPNGSTIMLVDFKNIACLFSKIYFCLTHFDPESNSRGVRNCK